MQDRECEEIIEMAEGPSVCAPSEEHAEHPALAVQEGCAYGIKVRLQIPYDEALSAVRHVLGESGFVITGETDVRELMQGRLGIMYPRYTILHVCDPDILHQSLELDRDLGLLLPHHVIVYEQSGGSVIAAIDTMAQIALADGRDLRSLARMAKEKLRDVINRVAAGAG
jgi:uncharacterized protein (DUF302 family)